jgi:formylglycine-generating enzyme required for sulfatase activity
MERPNFGDSYGGTYILIEPGKFSMGDVFGDGLARELPVHQVEITRPFFIGERLVTQAHWSAIMGDNPSKFSDGWSAGLQPVERVSWTDAMRFLEQLNLASSGDKFLGFSGIWRLPTESEWEYSARSGTESKWCFGNLDSMLDEYGWHAGNSGASTKAVGQKKANLWGLLDIYGLISEWCQDNFKADYSDKDSSQDAFTEKDNEKYVHRGGSWFTESDSTRSSSRNSSISSRKSDGIGLRLVWEPIDYID